MSLEDLLARVSKPDTNLLTIDLPEQTITVDSDDLEIPFEIDPLRKDVLIHGLDAVSATLRQYADDIRAFERDHRAANPWFT